MPGYFFNSFLAIFLVCGTWLVSHPRSQADALAPWDTQSVEPEMDVLDLRTGDRFWGFHLDGVVPCSSMLVKKGGHLVTLSLPHDRTARCFYHVVGERPIDLEGQLFRLRVVGPDEIHVEREAASRSASVSP